MAFRHRAPLDILFGCTIAVIVAVMMAAGTAARAQPQDRLQVHLPGADDPQVVTLTELSELPQHSYHTSTVWTEGVHAFSGVLLRDLLDHLGVPLGPDGGHVVLDALDGYTARIEADLITDSAPLLSFLRDGKPLPRREQGPFWLIFPYDDDPAFRTEAIYARSVWQIVSMTVIP